MTERDIESRKQEARARARAARCALDPATCADLATKAAENLLALEAMRKARVVLAYAASAEELDPAPAFERLREWGVRIALPRIESRTELSARLVDASTELESGPFGIRQPSSSAARVRLESIDVVVVPGVAYDERGCRVGYGGGYYDRLLAGLPPTSLFVGYAYDEQIAEHLPSAEHDVLVHMVVTPSRVIASCDS